jgi:hypothetical protein
MNARVSTFELDINQLENHIDNVLKIIGGSEMFYLTLCYAILKRM